ncbi:uncharacterized protein LOC121375443 [Gigantopelta aegis]|uniref:uncharacterized protein LOC121375443 n=1 Tax=Gigantopelta aegis TaxID=1735272 RepID=UPI001B88D2A3|nr:uncharacterized protein LOC121375443 [Gigantopelta aegis]
MKLILLLCLTVAAVYGQTCPSSSPDAEFGSDMSFSPSKRKSAEEFKAEKALEGKIGRDAVAAMKSADRCESSRVRRAAAAAKLQSIAPNWWYYWQRNCEPCPPNARILYRFHRNRCFVIFAPWQQVRVVTCSRKKCASPCNCGNSFCFPTAWTRVWFFGWCSTNIGGWRAGINFHYLYLPQDCTCYEQIFYRKRIG